MTLCVLIYGKLKNTRTKYGYTSKQTALIRNTKRERENGLGVLKEAVFATLGSALTIHSLVDAGILSDDVCLVNEDNSTHDLYTKSQRFGCRGDGATTMLQGELFIG